MKLLQKNEIANNIVKTTIKVSELGTTDLTAEEELELLHNFKYTLEYGKIDFTANMKLVDGVPAISTDEDAEEVKLALINRVFPVDENFEVSLEIDKDSVKEVGTIFNTKELVAQAQITLFNTKVIEELTKIMVSMRSVSNDFESETEYTI